MAPQVGLIIGGAGCGKTTRLLGIMEKILKRGEIGPLSIGFVSFTRAARSVAARRAADLFGIRPTVLEQDGWFRTVHSICYRQLAVGDALLTGGKKDCAWLAEQISEPVSGAVDSGEVDDALFGEGRTDADKALAIWSLARNSLKPVQTVWNRVRLVDWETPDVSYVLRVIDSYEMAKRLSGRCDFTDILGRFAGIRFTVEGPTERTPEGDVPDVPVWFCDEQQDTSPLQDIVLRRLTANARWVYLVGDPFQAIFGFNGSDPQLFQRWPVADGLRDILRQTHRCPAPIQSLGEDILRECSDYWDRGIRPKDGPGEVDSDHFQSAWESQINPDESWLLVARSNWGARKLSGRLDAAGIPWLPVRGNNRWNAPKRTKAIESLWNLQRGGVLSIEDWERVIEYVPSKHAGKEFLIHGTKKRWSSFEGDRSELTNLEGLKIWGATPELVERVKSGQWVHLVDHADLFAEAVERFGWKSVLEPKVRVGTVHSVKGDEAENVVLLTTTSQIVARGEDDQDGFNEERRISYVAVTRSSRRLLVLKERCLHQMRIPV